MKLSEFKAHIRDMGFTDDAEVEDNLPLIIDSLKQALKTISTTVKGITSHYDVVLDEPKKLRIDLLEATKNENAQPTFDTLEEILFDDGETVTTVSNWRLLRDSTYYVDCENAGTYCFYYRTRPIIPEEDGDESELPIAYECEPMLPLLASYYIWLDDDMEEATRWYNEYDNLKKEYLQKVAEKQPRARIRTDLGYGTNLY